MSDYRVGSWTLAQEVRAWRDERMAREDLSPVQVAIATAASDMLDEWQTEQPPGPIDPDGEPGDAWVKG